MFFSYGFLNIFIFIVRIQYVLHITYNVCDNQLFMLFKTSGQKKAIFGGDKSYMWIFDYGGVVPLTPLFKG